MYGSTRTLGLSYSEQVDQFQSYSTFSVHLKFFLSVFAFRDVFLHERLQICGRSGAFKEACRSLISRQHNISALLNTADWNALAQCTTLCRLRQQ